MFLNVWSAFLKLNDYNHFEVSNLNFKFSLRKLYYSEEL